jgi:hypothetical protein
MKAEVTEMVDVAVKVTVVPHEKTRVRVNVKVDPSAAQCVGVVALFVLFLCRGWLRK